MNKIFKNPIFTFITGVIICGTTGVIASNLMANNVSYSPNDSSWGVNNVEAAIDSLYVSKTESNYSTEEQVVGTWIDGKPIYQRTMVLQYGTYDRADASYMHGWDVKSYNIDTPIDSKIIYASNGNLKVGNSISSDSMTYSVYSELNKDYFWITTGNTQVSRMSTIYATIQYTKTTDQASN